MAAGTPTTGERAPGFRRSLVRMFGLLRPYRRQLGLSIVLAAIAQGLSLAIPSLTGRIIDDGIRPRDTHEIEVLSAIVIVIAAVRMVVMIYRRLIAGTMAVTIEYDLRNRVYAHLQRLSFGYYDEHQTGQLMSRATADVGAVRIFLSYGLLFMTQHVITITAALVVMFVIDPVLALIALAVLPLLAGLATSYSRVSHPVLKDVQQKLADVTTQAEESVVGVRVVKAFGQEQREVARFRERSEAVFAANISANRLRARYVPLLEFLPGIALAIVLLVGGRRVIAGDLTLGGFVTFNLLLGMLVLPLRMVGMLIGQVQRAIASSERVYEVLDAREDVVAPARPIALATDGGGAIRFEGVDFRYGTGREVLHAIDLDVPAGSTVALVGATGSGKTTLAQLVPRYYDPTAGRVLIDGVDVRDLDLGALRRAVGIVAQDSFLFSATLRENIAFGVPDATEDDVRRAAGRAQAAEFIEALPHGYDTLVGERGLTLSGGQRQRIAIARALLVDPRILILDDATASVDASTEAKIRDALAEVMRGRTTIIIAHRASTIALADSIVAVEGGRIVARGGHDALYAGSETYRQIADHGRLDTEFVDFDGDRVVVEEDHVLDDAVGGLR